MSGVVDGFYSGVFYPSDSPLYDPTGSGDIEIIAGDCFAPVGQPENYRGFLYQTATLLADSYLYA